MPNLDYIEEPITASFKSTGGQFPPEGKYPRDDYYGLSIIVPPNAVPKDQEVKLKIGMCCYGPFAIDENYEVASDFVVIVADQVFDKPVTVVMEHCLILQEYRESSEVLIMKASHLRVTGNDLYTFNPLSTHPKISSESPELSFEINEFCILCAVKQNEQIFASLDSLPSSPAHIDDDNPSSTHSSVDEDVHPLSCSMEYQTPILKSLSTSSASSFESLASPQTGPGVIRKRKSDSLDREATTSRMRLATSAKKKQLHRRNRSGRQCAKVEYNAILFQNKKKVIDVENSFYQFVIFICRSCPVSREVSYPTEQVLANTTFLHYCIGMQ